MFFFTYFFTYAYFKKKYLLILCLKKVENKWEEVQEERERMGAWHSLDSDYNIIHIYIFNNINKA